MPEAVICSRRLDFREEGSFEAIVELEMVEDGRRRRRRNDEIEARGSRESGKAACRSLIF
jgi:hypothetical protein